MNKMQINKRSPFLAGVICLLFGVLSLLMAVDASAQRTQLTHPTTTPWRYLADGSDQGVAWQASGFDDSSWPQGTGLFGNESNYPYPMGTTIPGLTPINVYYRTHFSWSGGTFGVVLTGTNYVDDGSIIYLNGVEIARFNMPAGLALFDTVAPTANPGGFPNVNAGEPVLVQLQIPLGALTNGNANPLVTGDNVIAVEVHQNSATSSDRVFGLALYGQQAVAPCTDGIQPTNRVIIEGTSTTFVMVEGANCGVPAPSFQWYRNVGAGEELIVGATGTSYTLTNSVDVSDEGVYYCRLTNPSGTVDSRQAVRGIESDVFPPVFLSATVVGPGLNTFRLTVNEALCIDPGGLTCGTDATLAFNWHIYQSDALSTDLGVASVAQINPTTYEFTTSFARDPSKQYRITVDDPFGEVGDVHGNRVAPGTFAESGLELGFQQGDANGYAGTQDAGIHSGTGVDTPAGGDAVINVDGDDGGIRQALLRFDNIFGTAVGQIPPGAVITSATLTLNQTDNGNPANLHRLLVNWDQSTATWNSLSGGLSADGVEAASTADAASPGLNGVVGPITIDVTTSVRAWAAGQPNYGWAILPGGGDGWRWNASESGASTAPRLSVQFSVGVCTTAPTFTAQPVASTTVNELSSFSLSAGVEICGDAAFQWTKNNVDIPGATAITYSVPSAVAGAGGSGGTYRLRASNQFGSVTSDPAVVTVNPKTTHPHVTRVVNGANGTTITVAFNEAVTTASAQNTANYALTPSVAVSSAVLGANNTVTLTTAPRTAGTAYSLRIAGVTDPAAAPNAIEPNPTIVILTSGTPVAGAGWGDAWLVNTNNLNGTPTWKDDGFVAGADWQNGNGLFGTEASAGVVALFPVPIATAIPANDVAPGDFVTCYFRKSVTLPALSGGAIYVLDHMIDDGAVFYLNGVEFGRFNMTNGPVVYSTRAATANEASRQALRLPASANAGGTFTLAVEVHQGGATTSSDVVFGAQIVAVAPLPALSISHGGSGNTVSWNGDSSWRLVRSATVAGPYAAVGGNPFHSFVVPPAANTNSSFFMLEFVPAP